MPSSMPDPPRITPQDLEARLRRGERIVVLDVRARDTWAAEQGQIPGAMWIPLEEVPERARDLRPDAETIVYCT